MNELYHHGIKNQKWGVQNGPPYPLDYKDLSPEEKQAAKEDAIRRGDVEEVKYNAKYFSDDEVRAAINRFDLNKQLNSITIEPSKIDKAQDFMDKATKVADMTNKGLKVWNTFAKVANGVSDTKLPVIDEKTGENLTNAVKANAAQNKYNEEKAKADLKSLNDKLERGTTQNEGYYDAKGKFHATKIIKEDYSGNKTTINVADRRYNNEYSTDPVTGKRVLVNQTTSDANGNKYTFNAVKQGFNDADTLNKLNNMNNSNKNNQRKQENTSDTKQESTSKTNSSNPDFIDTFEPTNFWGSKATASMNYGFGTSHNFYYNSGQDYASTWANRSSVPLLATTSSNEYTRGRRFLLGGN